MCDPPYGVRESGKRVRASEGRLTEEQRKDRMPSSQTYLLGECMADLLNR